MSTLRVGPPLDKVDRHWRHRGARAAGPHQRLVDQGVAEGATCWQPQIGLPSRGFYYPPTLLSNVHPTSIVAQQEIFGPVLAAMTFRTPSEAVELANNTVYGLAACVWSESINVALQVAAQLKAGVVWVNCTNLFDAACGFGGYRESGYGREGGREGMLEYLEPTWFKKLQRCLLLNPLPPKNRRRIRSGDSGNRSHRQALYRRQAGSTRFRLQHGSARLRWATSRRGAARKSQRHSQCSRSGAQSCGWAKSTAHNRAQVLYYMAEKLSQRREEIARRLATVVGEKQAAAEVEIGIERIFSYAAWADKFDGAVHNPPFRNVAMAMNEPIGTVGVICPIQSPSARFSLAGHASAGGRQHGRRGSFGGLPIDHLRPLPSVRHQRSAGRGGQHRHRILLATPQDTG